MAPKNVELHPHPWPFWDILKKSDTPGYYTLVINPINIYIYMYMCVYVCMYVYKYIYISPLRPLWLVNLILLKHQKKLWRLFPIDSLIPQRRAGIFFTSASANPGESRRKTSCFPGKLSGYFNTLHKIPAMAHGLDVL